MTDAPEVVVDALYGGEAKAFVTARDAAVRELRAAGRREEAAAVKALARPTVAAAGINRAVRSGAADDLWAAGDALAAAQSALLAGDADAAALREAKATREEALERAVAVAGEGARETLRAASVDAEVRADVASGRLAKEPAVGSGGGGLGGFEAFAAATGGDDAVAPSPAVDSDAKARAREQARAKRAAEDAAKAEAAARAKQAEKARKALEKRLDAARARAARSADALDGAHDALARAEEASAADAEAVSGLEAELAAAARA